MNLKGNTRKGILQTFLDQRNGEMRDVDADPLPVQFMRRMHRGAAAAERIEHHVARVGRGGENTFEQGDGFLRGIAEAFLSLGLHRNNVCPDISNWVSLLFIQKSLE